MAKRRRHETTSSPSPPSPSPTHVPRIENQMRGLIEAARAPRARRFVKPMQVKSWINAIINSEVARYETVRIRKQSDNRSRNENAVRGTPLYRRNALHRSSVLRARLSQPVRDLLLDSERALECARRETRREVMFALHRTGKNGRKNKRARWTADSRISCKRR